MAKRKHTWHCGLCNCDLHVTKGKKGTKYLYCPHCQHQIAYHNSGILGAVAKIGGKTLLKAIPGVGTAITLAEGAADVYNAVKGTSAPKTAGLPSEHHAHTSSYPLSRKVHDALR